VLANYGLAPERLAAQLDDLLARGFNFISLSEWRAAMAGRSRLPRKAVLVTFDDCYVDLLPAVREILVPRQIAALAFAVTGMASGTNEWDQAIGARSLALLDANGLHDLQGHGIEIGCHSRTHRSLTQLGDAQLEGETRGAADDLERAGLPRPRAFAYPYGETDERSRRAVRAAGFAMAFGLRRARADARREAFDLPRVEILAQDRGWRFRLKTTFPRLSRVIG
jgi:peptidoglycan/xylan/chitin deacetylase (PgdA/CDA1 family)